MSAVADRSENRKLALGGVISFVGAGFSATLTFLLTLVLARTLGDSGAGEVLQAVAVFTITLSTARLGMDSCAVWILPRLKASEPVLLRSAAWFQIQVAFGVGIICAVALAVCASALTESTIDNTRALAQLLLELCWFLPAASVMLVALSITRGLGGVHTYVAVGSIALPGSRLGATAIAAIVSGSVSVVALAWAAPLVPALAAALIVAWLQIKRAEEAATLGRWTAPRELRRKITVYALPRTASAILEQSLLWLDVVLVGTIAGSAASGIYAGASRFVSAGFVVEAAIRVVVAPKFSELLHRERYDELNALYRNAAMWLVLLGTPLNVMLAVFAPTVLAWLGPDFVAGELVMVILCVGGTVLFLAGNIQSMLLMSGYSGWAAINKVMAVTLNVAGNVVLVPIMGIEGAAVSWTLSMLVDAALATVQVRFLIGVSVRLWTVLLALAVSATAFGLPAIVFRLVFGTQLLSLIFSGAIGLIFFTLACWLFRRPFGLVSLLRRRLPQTGDKSSS